MFINLGYVISNVVILIYVFDGCLAENIFVNNSHPNLIRQRRQSCGQSEFQCTDIHQCIPSYKFCDGTEDCRDKTDETSKCSTVDCPPYAYRCAYGACVTGDARCDGIKHCADNSDENGCGNENPNTNNNCRPGQFSCDSGMCIDQFNVCDGKRHCGDGSDETAKQCGSQECPDYGFRCAYGACIDGDARCNGTVECADGSDEARSICGGSLITTPSTITQSPALKTLTLEERIFIIKAFYETCGNIYAVQHKFSVYYGLDRVPMKNIILRLVERFEKTGSVFKFKKFTSLVLTNTWIWINKTIETPDTNLTSADAIVFPDED